MLATFPGMNIRPLGNDRPVTIPGEPVVPFTKKHRVSHGFRQKQIIGRFFVEENNEQQ